MKILTAVLLVLCGLPALLAASVLPIWISAAVLRLPRRSFWRACLATLLATGAGLLVTAVLGAPLTALIPAAGALAAFLIEGLAESAVIVLVYRCRFWLAAAAWGLSTLLDGLLVGTAALISGTALVGGSLAAYLAQYGLQLPAWLR